MSNHVRRDIQELRGVAITLVVLYHAGELVSAGFVGVDAFFVISGFVIAQSIKVSLQSAPFSFGEFVGKRVRRILPALSVVLVVTLLASTWLSSVAARVQTVRTGIFASFGTANLFLYRFRPDGYFEVSEKSNALLHTWSLSLEEQVYLMLAVGLAVVVKAVGRDHVRRTILFILTGVFSTSLLLAMAASHFNLSVVNPLLRRVLSADELDATFSFYLPFTRAWEFLVGVGIAIFAKYGWSTAASRKLRFIGLVLLAVSGLATPKEDFPNVFSVVPVVAVALVILGGRNYTGHEFGKGGAVLRWLGDRSYSWYLWHWPVIQFVTPFSSDRWVLILAACFSLIPAHFSYEYIEQYFRTQRSWKSMSRTVVIGVLSVALPLMASLTTRDIEPDLAHHIDAQMGCEYGLLDRLQPGGPCTVPFEGATKSAILLGDSHAGHLSEGFLGATRELGFNAILAVRGNSPFLYPDGARSESQPSESQRLVDLAIGRGVSVAVIAQSSYSSSARPWEEAFRPVIEDLTRAGIRVVLVAQSLLLDADPRKCSPLQIRLSMCKEEVTRQTQDLLNQRDRIAAETLLASKYQGVVLFDSAQYLCPFETCSNRQNDQWWWRDGGHIAIPASIALTPSLKEAMVEAMNEQS